MTDNRRKAIVYSLFGFNKEKHPNCFNFDTYIRGLSINTRLARLIYPDFDVVLETDQSTYNGFKSYFDAMPIIVHINEPSPLTKAMLWRLKPAFEILNGKWKYSHVICRDLDSAISYREAQAVQYWMNKDKAVHAITDSISHDVPMLGGMIGVKPDYFTERVGAMTWDSLINRGSYNWEIKGMDQTFMTNEVYPKFAQKGNDSITQHYVLGMPNSFLSDWHREIQDIDIPNVPHEYKCTNDCVVHIGQAGWNEAPTIRIFSEYADKFRDITEAEKNFTNIFYWGNA